MTPGPAYGGDCKIGELEKSITDLTAKVDRLTNITESELTFGDRLIIGMLCELFQHHKTDGQFDPNFIQETISSGHQWALRWKYGWQLNEKACSDEIVQEVCDMLDMWKVMEIEYLELSQPDKDYIKKNTKYSEENVKFPGFDSHHNSIQLSVTQFVIEHLKGYAFFWDRDMEAVGDFVDRYRRMLLIFNPILNSLGSLNITKDQFIELLDA